MTVFLYRVLNNNFFFLVYVSEKAIPRPFSSNRRCYRTAAEESSRPSSALQRRPPRSSPTAALSRAASEISEIEDIDVTECDDPLLEDSSDRQALADLESELQTNAGIYAILLCTHSKRRIFSSLISSVLCACACLCAQWGIVVPHIFLKVVNSPEYWNRGNTTLLILLHWHC